MARAWATRETDWNQCEWLKEAEDGQNLPWGVLIFTDEVKVLRHEDGKRPLTWFNECCQDHHTGDLLEARLFGERAEILIRRETNGEWLCRLVSDDVAPADEVELTEEESNQVYLWGERLDKSNTWFEQRIKPLVLPLEGKGKLAVAQIKVYKRENRPPVWRFVNLTSEGAS